MALLGPSLFTAALLVLTFGAASTAGGADVAAGRRKAEPCVACHGAGGNSTNPAVPSLAGQRDIYLHWQLLLFRDQRRRDPQMSPFAANLSDADIADLAAYYAEQPPIKPSPVATEPDKIAAGRRLAETHHCITCHNPRGAGPHYPPRLSALHFEYVIAQLRGFRAQTRAELDGTMTSAAQPLSEDDIENLAHYLASLPLAP